MHLNNPLLPYQQEAVNKLIRLKVGALFMEQGTGKTITALELCRLRLEAGKVDHILWLCPCSTRQNLLNELKKQAPGQLLAQITICGMETLSHSIRVNDYLLKLVTQKHCYLVVDESLLVKNPNTYRTQNVERLAGCCTYKLILNGMPISRNEADLYAQFRILDWRILGYRSYWSFAANHIEYSHTTPQKITRCLNTEYLARKIEPYTVSILKKDCLKLPEKNYYVDYFELTRAQRQHYNEVADILLFKLDETRPETIYRLFCGLQAVICGLRVDFTADHTGYQHISTSPFFKDPLDNPRISLLLSLLDPSQKQIIFCNYVYEIEAICKLLSARFGPDQLVRFDGSSSIRKRTLDLERFSNKAAFLIANRECAGYSLNLQFCHNIIYCSNGWDLATRLQSEDRIHRLGQISPITIRDICAANTLDDQILSSLYRKEKLLDSFRSHLKHSSVHTIADWLRIPLCNHLQESSPKPMALEEEIYHA